MDGFAFVSLVESELKRQGIPKGKFYEESGISSATMSQWRKGIYSPSGEKIKEIEKYLGVSFEIGQKNKPTDEIGELSEEELELLEWFRTKATNNHKAIIRLMFDGMQ